MALLSVGGAAEEEDPTEVQMVVKIREETLAA